MTHADIRRKQFMELSETHKTVVICMGIETLIKAYTLNGVGHMSIDGHCYYLDNSTNSMIDLILLTLNGDCVARDKMSDFITNDKIRGAFDTLLNFHLTKHATDLTKEE